MDQEIVSAVVAASKDSAMGGRVVNGKYQPTDEEIIHHEQV
jgi:hypothetical protein